MIDPKLFQFINWSSYIEKNKLTQDEILLYIDSIIKQRCGSILIEKQEIDPETVISIFDKLSLRDVHKLLKLKQYDFKKYPELLAFLKLKGVDVEYRGIQLYRYIADYEISTVKHSRTFSVTIDGFDQAMGNEDYRFLVLAENRGIKIYPQIKLYDSDDEDIYYVPGEDEINNGDYHHQMKFMLCQSRNIHNLENKDAHDVILKINARELTDANKHAMISLVEEIINKQFKTSEEFVTKMESIHKCMKDEFDLT